MNIITYREREREIIYIQYVLIYTNNTEKHDLIILFIQYTHDMILNINNSCFPLTHAYFCHLHIFPIISLT